VYLVCGEEDVLREEATAAIKAAVLSADPEGMGLEGFNSDLLYGDESDAAEILARASEVPAFAPRRLVIVKDADRLPAREGEALLPYLMAPCESTTLVFVAAKLDQRMRFGKTLKDHAVVVDCAPPFSAQVDSWVRTDAGRIGVRLGDDAMLLIKEVAGESLRLARQELEKLAAYLPKGRTAGADDVEAVRGGLPGASVFDLVKAIGAGDRGRALRILARNLEAGEAPVRILGSLIWQYRQLWKAKEAAARSGGAEAARLFRMPPCEAKAWLARFTPTHLRSAFQRFHQTDARLKGGSASAPALVLESLLLNLCDEVASGSPRGARQFPTRPPGPATSATTGGGASTLKR
jgi:DNA polymerase-3 subunit delta